MADYTELRLLGQLVRRFEPEMDAASLTILSYEHRDSISQALVAGLGAKIDVQSSSGEYSNQLAVLKVGANKYTFAQDYRETYLSEINYCTCRIIAEANGVLVYHTDYPGVIYDVSRILAEHKINISKMNVSREQKGKQALLVSLTDEEILPDVLSALEQLPQVTKVVSLK